MVTSSPDDPDPGYHGALLSCSGSDPGAIRRETESGLHYSGTGRKADCGAREHCPMSVWGGFQRTVHSVREVPEHRPIRTGQERSLSGLGFTVPREPGGGELALETGIQLGGGECARLRLEPRQRGAGAKRPGPPRIPPAPGSLPEYPFSAVEWGPTGPDQCPR